MILTTRRPAGHLIGGDGSQQDTFQCVHCDRHVLVVPGSGKVRGFCMKCAGPTCGGKKCVDCNGSFEKQMELIERNATKHLRGY